MTFDQWLNFRCNQAKYELNQKIDANFEYVQRGSLDLGILTQNKGLAFYIDNADAYVTYNGNVTFIDYSTAMDQLIKHLTL